MGIEGFYGMVRRRERALFADTRSTPEAKKTSPRKDFFKFVNEEWMRGVTIPSDEGNWNTFDEVNDLVEAQQFAILEGRHSKKPRKGSTEQQVFDFFTSATDTATREQVGVSVLDDERAEIHAVTERDQLIPLIARMRRTKGIAVFIDIGVGPDAKNAKKNALHAGQPELGMPDRDYYLTDSPDVVRVRDAYVRHIQKIFHLAGYSYSEAREFADVVMSIEKRLAGASIDKVSRRDPEKTYHKHSRSELQAANPGLNWGTYLDDVGATRAKDVIIEHPPYLSEVENMLATVDLKHLKIYMEWQLLNESASLLSKDFVDEDFNFYGKTLGGQKQRKTPQKEALESLNESLREPAGRLYAQEYFDEEARKEVIRMFTDIKAACRRKIRSLTWMTKPTQDRALKKLDTLKIKIGHPDEGAWLSYAGLDIQAGDYYGNCQRIAEYEHNRSMGEIGTNVDQGRWYNQGPQTVNAQYIPTKNEIMFPAGILQPPFFDKAASFAQNYGAIGAVIAHEIGHVFDDKGSMFDEHGNVRDWWDKESRANYEQRTAVMVREYSKYSVEGVQVNGELTLGENLADLMGIEIAYMALEARLEREGRPPVGSDGLTAEQQFFVAYATIWREKARPENARYRATNNPHAPHELRVNVVLSMFPPFYDAFGIEPGDGMYRAPEDRANI